MESRAETPTRIRYLVLTLLAMAAFSAYLTRTAISAAATTVERELALSHEQMGVVFAAFSTGYFWFQIPAGWIGTRWGRRRTLAAFGALWSGFAGLTAVAHSMTVLWLTRFGMGSPRPAWCRTPARRSTTGFPSETGAWRARSWAAACRRARCWPAA